MQNIPPIKREWPSDQVERRPIEGLIPYARNARTHSDAQIAQIAASIREWGWTNPVLVDEHGTIIAGHGRVLAARQLGITDIPVIVARGWTPEQKSAYVIADNKLTLGGGWDTKLLIHELSELDSANFSLDLTGFGKHELENLFAPMTPLAEHWGGMPEFDQEDQKAYRSIVVHFPDEDAVEAFAKTIGQAIGKVKSIWFPPADIGVYADKRYTTDEAT